MPDTGAQRRRNGRGSRAQTIGRRLTPAGMALLPDEMRAPVEAALARGGCEAWVIAPDEGGLRVEVRNLRA